MEHTRNTSEEKKNENLAYACCPRCSKTLIQAISVHNGIVKCENCHRRYVIEIQDGKVSVQPLNKTEQ